MHGPGDIQEVGGAGLGVGRGQRRGQRLERGCHWEGRTGRTQPCRVHREIQIFFFTVDAQEYGTTGNCGLAALCGGRGKQGAARALKTGHRSAIPGPAQTAGLGGGVLEFEIPTLTPPPRSCIFLFPPLSALLASGGVTRCHGSPAHDHWSPSLTPGWGGFASGPGLQGYWGAARSSPQKLESLFLSHLEPVYPRGLAGHRKCLRPPPGNAGARRSELPLPPPQPLASPSPSPPATLPASPAGPSGVCPVSRRLFLACSFFVLALMSPQKGLPCGSSPGTLPASTRSEHSGS